MHTKKPTTSQGFLLIESLVALAFFSLISLILIQFQLRIVMMQNDGLRQLKALSIAQNYIESWLLQVKQKSEKEPQTTHTLSAIQNSFFSLQATLVPTSQLNYELLKVTVTWQTPYGEEKSITLYAGTGININC